MLSYFLALLRAFDACTLLRAPQQYLSSAPLGNPLRLQDIEHVEETAKFCRRTALCGRACTFPLVQSAFLWPNSRLCLIPPHPFSPAIVPALIYTLHAGQGNRRAAGPERSGGAVRPGGRNEGRGRSRGAFGQGHPEADGHGVRNPGQGSVSPIRRAFVKVSEGHCKRACFFGWCCVLCCRRRIGFSGGRWMLCTCALSRLLLCVFGGGRRRLSLRCFLVVVVRMHKVLFFCCFDLWKLDQQLHLRSISLAVDAAVLSFSQTTERM